MVFGVMPEMVRVLKFWARKCVDMRLQSDGGSHLIYKPTVIQRWRVS